MPIIDREQLNEHVEGDLGLLADTFEFFCEDGQSLLAELRHAVATSDFDSFCRHAHKMKGMLSNFHATSACQTVEKLEQIKTADDLANATPLLDQLTEQLEFMKSELRQIIQSGKF